MGEGLRVGGRARRGLALSTVGSDLTCDKHRGFPLCTLDPEGVLALELGPHTEEDKLVYRTLLQDPHARQICEGEGQSWVRMCAWSVPSSFTPFAPALDLLAILQSHALHLLIALSTAQLGSQWPHARRTLSS